MKWSIRLQFMSVTFTSQTRISVKLMNCFKLNDLGKEEKITELSWETTVPVANWVLCYVCFIQHPIVCQSHSFHTCLLLFCVRIISHISWSHGIGDTFISIIPLLLLLFTHFCFQLFHGWCHFFPPGSSDSSGSEGFVSFPLTVSECLLQCKIPESKHDQELEISHFVYSIDLIYWEDK